MKRLLLFSMILIITGSLSAQNTQLFNTPQNVTSPLTTSNDFSTSLFHNEAKLKNPDLFLHQSNFKKDAAISRSGSSISFYKIGSSFNAYGLLYSQSNCLSADTALNLIMFVHRACVYYVNNGGNDGWINTSYSTDGGMTWDTSILAMQAGGTNTDTGCRYPSGTIFNPAGNTTVSHAFGVVSGPYTDNSNWVGYYFGSALLTPTSTGDSLNEQLYPIVDTASGVFNQYFPNIATTVAGKYIYILGDDQYISTGTGTATGPFNGSVINKATFNSTADTFSWTQQEIHIPIALNPSTSVQYTGSTNSGDMAWSADDSVGYIVHFGVDSVQFASAGVAGYFPIVYKSTDSGKTWNKLPYYHFDTSSNIVAILPQGGYSYYPVMSAYDGSKCVVDNNYNLHIYTDILAKGSNNPDSIGYATILPDYIFDLSTSDGITWHNRLVDSLMSAAYNSGLWTSSSGDVFVSARIQAAVTTDHTKAFVTWLDTEPYNSSINDYPNIYSAGFDYTDGYRTPAVNFTGNTPDSTLCYWSYTSTTAFSNSGTYTIPATISLSANGEDDADSNMVHYFVSGITFSDADFTPTGIDALAKRNIGVTIYPNPTSGYLNISFTKYTGQASIIITNILGSTVKQFNNINIANNQVSLNLEDLDSGIYFLKVETAQGSETQKIVIADKN